MRILLIESDHVLAKNLENYLTKKGHQVDWQFKLQDAVDSADRLRPDAVILDLLLCCRSGIEFLYEFRSYPDWQNIPVIVFSSVTPDDLGPTMTCFDQLNIMSYHHKPTTTFAQLAASVDIATPVRV